jgi:UDP-GlcNAc:undecaprenyl-phosphate GlcNAc-1-phosphate transferase
MRLLLELPIIALVPMVLSLVITPMVIRIANRFGVVDLPNERKIHTQPTPRLGGLAPFLSLALSSAALVLLDPGNLVPAWIYSPKGFALGASLSLIMLLGAIDDAHALKPGLKFAVQLLIATACYYAGFRISIITNPFNGGMIPLGSLDYPLTVMWIAGVTNAFNLIDGLDGLACGVSVIAALTICSITLLNGDPGTAMLALMLAGSLLGFLCFNFNPARIFLGDSGSLFIGLALAVLSIESSTKGSTAVAMGVPILALGLPIMDTLLSMTRRLLGSFLPGTPRAKPLLARLHAMFLPDKRHIHHQLLSLGLSQRGAVLLLYLVSCAFGAGAFAVTTVKNIGASPILVAVAVASLAGVRQLRYKEMAILRNGMLLPLYEWPMINRSIVRSFLDLAFMAASFGAALWLTGAGDHDLKTTVFTSLPTVCGIQISLYSLLGLYRGTFRYLGIGDLLKIVRAVALSVIASSIALGFVAPGARFGLPLYIIDFYVLLTLTAGSRISFHVLNYMFRKETKKGKRVLIYGADQGGMLTLQQILNDDSLDLMPLGFLDDDPGLEGKRIDGYEVFGSHWKVARLIRKHHVDEIIISSDQIGQEAFNRIRQACDAYGVIIRRPRVLLEDIPAPPSKPPRRFRPSQLPEEHAVPAMVRAHENDFSLHGSRVPARSPERS